MDQLAGKVAFVTGSAGGIGLGIARACVAAEMRVVLSDIDESTLAGAAAALRHVGGDVMVLPLDVTDRDGWARAAERVHDAMGPVQLLVNNAGVTTLGVPFDEVGPELWDRVIAINLTGVYNGVHTFLPAMRAVGDGHVVNVSSMGGLVCGPQLAPYSASKAAVVALSEALRAELRGSGIGVSVVLPGSVRTRLWRTSRVIRGLPDIETPPPGLTIGSADPNAMDPDEVGRRVLDAVVADDPYVVTHPEFRTIVEDRHQRLLRGFDRGAAFAP